MRDDATVLSDIAALATALGVIAAVFQLLLSRRQARSSFEHEFVKRYWSICDDSVHGTSPDTEVQRRRYLRLCEDEFEVMRLGSISWRTWEVWHEAIREGAQPPSDDLHEYEWLFICITYGQHPGSSCPGIFRSGSGLHSSHLTARWPSSLSRMGFLASTRLRRRLYVHGARLWGASPRATR